jgi:hypothetical protein
MGCGNWGAVGIYESYDNTFYRNNFTDNYIHIYTDENSINSWDNGYPDGGNFWDDFEDRYPHVADIYQGAYQNETGNDGFWDGPYYINVENIDHYPMVPEFSSAALLSLFLSISIVVVVFATKTGVRKPGTN